MNKFLRSFWVSFTQPEFLGLFGFVLLILVGGTVFYHQVEGWRWIDALYFSVVTLTTIGYGDLTPQSDAGKIFTIIYIFVGLGAILAFIEVVALKALKENPVKELIEEMNSSNDLEKRS